MRRQFKIIQKGVIALLLLFCLTLKGQINRVLNPSFEQYTICGGFSGDCTGSSINFWESPSHGSPDWFDTCWGGIPSNYQGHQYPRTGNAYAGIVMFSTTINGDGYEYIEGQLSNGLIGGKEYCVTYYVSLADTECFAVSDLGAYLSISSVCKPNTVDTLPYIPQILNPSTNLLSDKIDWVPVSGEFTASGGEQYITIGRFDSINPYIYVGGGASNCIPVGGEVEPTII